MLYLITPTGNRSLQFGFCVEMMQNQDYNTPVTWIIIDDGQEHVETPKVKDWTIQHIKRPFSNKNTQGINLITGLQCCSSDSKILIIEDDDNYSNQWLKIMSSKLNLYNICGETKTRYYNIRNYTYRNNNNLRHSSLCSTGIHNGAAYAMLMKICKDQPRFIDMALWRNFKGTKHLFAGKNIVGIKGMPGKRGIGSGHDSLRNKDDTNHSVLYKWVGDYWANKYIDSMKHI